MRLRHQGSAPLPGLQLVLLMVGGVLAMRVTYSFAGSVAVAGANGTACLLVLIGLQRRRTAAPTSPVGGAAFFP